jgi:hypothetical protein
MEETHTIASLRRRGNIFSEVFCELLRVARYLWVHQQHTRRPPEGGGQHFARNWFLDACSVDICLLGTWCLFLLSSVTLTLPDVNLRHHMARCCLDIASLSYISTSCRWISAAHKCRFHKKAGNSLDFRARQNFQAPHLCFFCVNVSSQMTVNPRGLCRLLQYIWNLNSALRITGLEILFPSPRIFDTMLKTKGNTIPVFSVTQHLCTDLWLYRTIRDKNT